MVQVAVPLARRVRVGRCAGVCVSWLLLAAGLASLSTWSLGSFQPRSGLVPASPLLVPEGGLPGRGGQPSPVRGAGRAPRALGEEGHGEDEDDLGRAVPAVDQEEDVLSSEDPRKHEYRRLEDEYGRLEVLNSLLPTIVVLSVLVLNCLACCGHYFCFIRPTASKFLPLRPVVPADLKGRFKRGLCELDGYFGTCLCFAFCPACMVGDQWYRAGYAHAVLDCAPSLEQSCPGWRWFGAVGAFLALQDVAPCCLPCAMAVLRGGVGWLDKSGNTKNGGIDPLTPARLMFEMPHQGFDTFMKDCCLYCWCGPCAGTQEYAQVMELLNRGPVRSMAVGASGNTVVGQPVGTGQAGVQVGQVVSVK